MLGFVTDQVSVPFVFNRSLDDVSLCLPLCLCVSVSRYLCRTSLCSLPMTNGSPTAARALTCCTMHLPRSTIKICPTGSEVRER